MLSGWFRYAAQTWDAHLRASEADSSERIHELALRICDPRLAFLKAWWQCRSPKETSAYYPRFNPSHTTTLTVLTYLGLDNTMRFFFSLGHVDTEQRSHHERTAISWAAVTGRNGVVDVLLDNSAQLNIEDASGLKPTALAARYGHTATLNLLRQRGGELHPDQTSPRSELSQAESGKHHDTVDSLLDWYALHCSSDLSDKNSQLRLEKMIRDGKQRRNADMILSKSFGESWQINEPYAPVLFAIRANNASLVIALIEFGPRYDDRRTHAQETPLLALARHELFPEMSCVHIAETLLNRGANVDTKDLNGMTPLLAAIQERKEALASLLLEAGADSRGVYEGRTMLSYACEQRFHKLACWPFLHRTPLSYARSIKVVNELLAAGAEVNAQDEDGFTPLFYPDAPKIIRALVNAGAEVNQKDKKGRTALFHQTKRRAIDALLAAGADIDATDNSGRTSLDHRCLIKDVPRMKILLDRGAHFAVEDGKGRTAFDWSHESDKKDIIRLLTGQDPDDNTLELGFLLGFLSPEDEGSDGDDSNDNSGISSSEDEESEAFSSSEDGNNEWDEPWV